MHLMTFDQNFLDSSLKLFKYYKDLGDRTFAQISEGDIHWDHNHQSNSIAIIVNHLQGNMKSRWTDFLRSDGEKDWRNRDREFEAIIKTKDDMIEQWEEGWHCLFDALDSVDTSNFELPIYIRNKEHTVTEAIQRQLTHYAYHVGQIVFIGRMIKGADWQSLSIPKGQSVTYNEASFDKGKRQEHFTEEFVKRSQKDS